MDELERKIIAHELALIETAARIDADHIRAGMPAIPAGLVVGTTVEERVIRVAAIDLVGVALQRYENTLTDNVGAISLAAEFANRTNHRDA